MTLENSKVGTPCRFSLILVGASYILSLPEIKLWIYMSYRELCCLCTPHVADVMDEILSAYRKSSKQWCATLNKLAQVRQRGRKRITVGSNELHVVYDTLVPFHPMYRFIFNYVLMYPLPKLSVNTCLGKMT